MEKINISLYEMHPIVKEIFTYYNKSIDFLTAFSHHYPYIYFILKGTIFFFIGYILGKKFIEFIKEDDKSPFWDYDLFVDFVKIVLYIVGTSFFVCGAFYIGGTFLKVAILANFSNILEAILAILFIYIGITTIILGFGYVYAFFNLLLKSINFIFHIYESIFSKIFYAIFYIGYKFFVFSKRA